MPAVYPLKAAIEALLGYPQHVMTSEMILQLGHSPDPDDAFMFYALTQGLLDDEGLDEQINTVLDLAETLAEWEGACFWSIAEGEELSEDDLPAIYTRFRQLLSSYYLVHMMWYHGVMAWDAERLFQELQPVPRDELCPCGSGRIFGKCCLH